MTTYPTPASGHIHVTPEGRQLIIERVFRAPIEDVWASLTEPDRVARWYGIIEGDPLPGHTIMVMMTAEEGATAEPVLIIECDSPNRFVLETAGKGEPWRPASQLDAGRCGSKATRTSASHSIESSVIGSTTSWTWPAPAASNSRSWSANSVGLPLSGWTSSKLA